ncbi:MAG: phospholipid-binding protein MlaC [Myxococcota bacterium]
MSPLRRTRPEVRRTARLEASIVYLLLAAAPGLAMAHSYEPPGQEGDAVEAARAAVEETVRKGIAILQDDSLSPQVKRDRVIALAEERFDFDLIARLVLARSWRRFDPEQRAEFTREFKQHLAATYGDRLRDYSEETVEFGPAHLEANGDVTGETRVVGGAAGEGISVQYRMRNRRGEWKVIDVIIEGISMVSNFRSQVRDLMAGSTPDELIQKLHRKNVERSASRT